MYLLTGLLFLGILGEPKGEPSMISCLDQDVYDIDDDVVDNCEKGLDREEIEKIARLHIKNYFEGKSIPDVDIFSPKYIDLCVTMDICQAVDKAYAAMEKCGKFDTTSSEHLIAQDIRYVIKTLGEIRKKVPQDFAAGILLMHLELVEGVNLG
jgi:hypothetical protein